MDAGGGGSWLLAVSLRECHGLSAIPPLFVPQTFAALLGDLQYSASHPTSPTTAYVLDLGIKCILAYLQLANSIGYSLPFRPLAVSLPC